MEKHLKNVLIIYNPVSGWMPSKSLLFDLIHKLSDDGYVPTVYMTQKDYSITEALKGIKTKEDIVICCGGDGTLHDTINAMLKNKIKAPLGYIPIGTTNDFAITHQIPKDFSSAYDVIRSGEKHVLDIGNFNKTDYFSYIACFGAFTKLAYDAPQGLKNNLGHLAYIIEGTKELGNLNKSYALKINADGKIIEGDFIFGAVVNSISVAGLLSLPVTYDDLNDGYLEVLLVKSPENFFEFQDVAGSVILSNFDSENILTFKVKEIQFVAEEPIAWNLDGEFAGNKRIVNINVEDNALELVLKV